MSTELATRLGIAETQAQTSSDISRYYSVQNEVDFINKIDREKVSREDAGFYLTQNVLRFLGEFAGRVPYTHISYLQKDGALTFAGIDLSDSYRKIAEKGVREFDEAIGYEKIVTGLTGGADSATWISPPKIADYGFVFHFDRDSNNPQHIKEYILRYEERKGSIDRSQRIHKEISSMENPNTDRAFLQNPELSNREPGTLSAILSALDIDAKDILDSHLFEERVQNELKNWVDMYVNAVFGQRIEDAELILRAIYNRAYDIRQEIDGKPGYVPRPNSSIPFTNRLADNALLQHYSAQTRALPQGSCPSVRKSSADPFSNNDILTSLRNGTSIEDLAHGKWDYHDGDCVVCNTVETQVGPCDICKNCEKKFN